MEGGTIILENTDDPNDERNFALPLDAVRRVRVLQCMPVNLVLYFDGQDGQTRVVHEDDQGFDTLLTRLRTALPGFSEELLHRAKTHDEEMLILWENSA
jgi:hypothetical protein